MNQTEEEQLLALKQFWQRYGRLGLLVILLGVLIGSGWTVWQRQQHQQANAASVLFQSLTSAHESAQKPEQTPEQKAALNTTAKTLSEQLIKEHPDSVYAQFAGLFLAKDAVVANQLPEARERLAWVATHAKDAGLRMTAYQRLARVNLALNDIPAAEQALEQLTAPAFAAAKAEINGDLHYQQKKSDLAYTDYQTALQSDDSRRVFVELKRDDVAK